VHALVVDVRVADGRGVGVGIDDGPVECHGEDLDPEEDLARRVLANGVDVAAQLHPGPDPVGDLDRAQRRGTNAHEDRLRRAHSELGQRRGRIEQQQRPSAAVGAVFGDQRGHVPGDDLQHGTGTQGRARPFGRSRLAVPRHEGRLT